MPLLATVVIGGLALAITWALFRRVSRSRGFLLLGLGGLETLWFGVALARLSSRTWHNSPAVLRAMLPLLLLDCLGLLAIRRRPEPPSARPSTLLVTAWILIRILIPGSLYLALSRTF